MVLEMPMVDIAADDGAKADATEYPLPLHLLSQVTERFHAVYPLSSEKGSRIQR